MSTLIIAEAGVNHNGDLGMARRLIDVASDAGADLVKFQTFNADRLATAKAHKADYQIGKSDDRESQHAMLRRLELTREMHETLIEYAASRRSQFFSTAFDIEGLDMLVELGIRRFKIPSGEITNLPYLRHVGRLGSEDIASVILSTGMASLGEVEAALNALELAGTPRARITVLHCSTDYPTPMEDVNLRAMQTLGDAFGVAVGYSDHTRGSEVAVAAVALGATIIEKHFTLDRSLPGPDHKASLEPAELAEMVNAIRNIEIALGDGIKRAMPGETKNKSVARKSIVASRPIRSGEEFSVANLAVKRASGVGLSPMQWDDVLGRVAPRAFVADEPISL